MRTRLRKIGNSSGILIPTAMVSTCKLGAEVELLQEGKALIIRSNSQLRPGWFKAYRPALDTDAWAAMPIDDGKEEST